MKKGIIVGIGFSVLGGIALLVGIPTIVAAIMKGPLTERIAQKVPPRDIVLQDLRANCYGRESKGAAQVRGNGALVLTREKLYFFTLGTSEELTIPLSAVEGVGIVHSHLGKATPYKLLHVRYSEGGKPDSVAFWLSDVPAWKKRIEELKPAAK